MVGYTNTPFVFQTLFVWRKRAIKWREQYYYNVQSPYFVLLIHLDRPRLCSCLDTMIFMAWTLHNVNTCIDI